MQPTCSSSHRWKTTCQTLIMEAMACGTPVVGFDTGGIPEMIGHLESGFIAESQSAPSLSEGIQWVLKH